MKLKSKLIIASAALITISGAAAGTSTFAWFTANRSAYTEVNASVKTGTDTLKIALDTPTATKVDSKLAGDTNIATVEATTDSVDFAAGYSGTDISGNGLALYKVLVNSGTSATSDSTPVTSSDLIYNSDDVSATNAKTYYQQYRLSFSHTNTDITTGVFLSSNSWLKNTIDPAPTTDISAAYRVAILDENAGSLIAYYAPNEITTALCKVVHLPSTTSTTISDISWDATNTNLGVASYNFLGKTFSDVSDSTLGDKTHGNGYLGNIPSGTNAKLTITIRIWCEGNDANCITSVKTQTVKSNLVFNGVDMTTIS